MIHYGTASVRAVTIVETYTHKGFKSTYGSGFYQASLRFRLLGAGLYPILPACFLVNCSGSTKPNEHS